MRLCWYICHVFDWKQAKFCARIECCALTVAQEKCRPCKAIVVSLAGGTNLMRHAKKSTNRDFRMTFTEVSEEASEAVEQTL